MGVPGLWEILNKAGQSVSLAHLAVVRGFEQNTSGRRAYRIGIDVSIWFHHAAFSKGGENAELRHLFFRLLFLVKLPILPLFIFDGRQRPKMKRGSRLGKSGSHELSRNFKKFLDAFGMEWREAGAEAEAELAYLNRNGFIDAIMTDDCDAFLFGGCTILKNLSKRLSGNKNNPALNQDKKTDKLHTMLYSVNNLKNHPEIGLTRGGMILFALLAGGDYHPGVPNVGKVIAHSIARCDFGDELLEACQNLQGQDLAEFLVHWRGRVNQELKTNSHGFLKHRTSLSVPEDFPDMEALRKYTNPICSNANSSVALRDRDQLDLGRVGQLCEEYFEWGYKSRIIERFRTLMWPCAVMHILRRAALEIDRKKALSGSVVVAKDIGTSARAAFVQRYLSRQKEDRTGRYADAFIRRDPVVETAATTREIPDSHPLILGIAEKNRRHASTDGVLEYRVKISPFQLIELVTKSLKGKRSAPENVAEKPDDPNEAVNMWLPCAMLEHLYPDLVEQFLAKEQEKKTKKAKGKTKKGKEKAVDSGDSDYEVDSRPFPCSSNSPMSRRSPNSSANSHCDRAIHDPWFYSDSTIPSSNKSSAKQGFLFTCSNPSFDEFPEKDTKIQEEERPSSRSRFDHGVNHVLCDPTTKRKHKKRKEVVDPKTATGEGRPRKRGKIDSSASLLDVLDSLEF